MLFTKHAVFLLIHFSPLHLRGSVSTRRCHRLRLSLSENCSDYPEEGSRTNLRNIM